MGFGSYLNDLSITAAGTAANKAKQQLLGPLRSFYFNGGRDTNCKFYYDKNSGGSILNVLVKGVTNGVVDDLRKEAVNAFNSLLNKKKKTTVIGAEELETVLKKQQDEIDKYGIMKVNDGKNAVFALDDYGNVTVDALMLGVSLGKDCVEVSQVFPKPSSISNQEQLGLQQHPDRNIVMSEFDSDTLVWYDTTAIITINSDKNLIATKVAGRDYSRKELVSNGDIKFSVSGQITSKIPDIYPTDEMKKFYKIMQHKGIVKVNNIILDQLGITNIVIENFSVSAKEGQKAIQSYSFSGIGLQPKSEIVIDEDTIRIMDKPEPEAKKKDSKWMELLKGQLEGLKQDATEAVDHATNAATNVLGNILDKAL